MCDWQMWFPYVVITEEQNFLVYCLAVNLKLLLSLIISVIVCTVTSSESPIFGTEPIVISEFETHSHDPVSFVNFPCSALFLLYR